MEAERDMRSVIVDKIMMTMAKYNIPQEAAYEVKAQLEVELSKCEVYQRCTEITTINTTAFQFLQQFLDTKRIEGKSEGTIERYKTEVGKLLWYYHKPLDEYTTQDIRLYLDYRKRNGKYKETVSNRTLDGIRKCLSSFFKWCAAEQIIPHDPCLSIHQIKYKKTVRKVFSAVEMQKLREACKDIRELTLIDWLFCTGCRVAEVASSRRDMIDWNERSIIVTGKGDKERKVYFNEVTAMHLQEYLNSRTDVCVALFVSSRGNPMTVPSIQQTVKRIGERAGVANVFPHRFRHTFATYMAGKMSVIEVANLLGHNDISTTQVYCHANPAQIANNYRNAMDQT